MLHFTIKKQKRELSQVTSPLIYQMFTLLFIVNENTVCQYQHWSHGHVFGLFIFENVLQPKKKILTLPLLQFSPNLINKDNICLLVFKIIGTKQTKTVALRKQMFIKQSAKLTALRASVACAASCWLGIYYCWQEQSLLMRDHKTRPVTFSLCPLLVQKTLAKSLNCIWLFPKLNFPHLRCRKRGESCNKLRSKGNQSALLMAEKIKRLHNIVNLRNLNDFFI